ncbi:Heat shock protein 60 family co-chaperone GroES [Fructilactobacillus florum 8D]|uniref:Co-chaperonin GroES n=1 Tax=Fructilactobacillus florum 8D TaxID=1221538 RepID=W9EDT8_9LACO|nr:co-chaperone GroES [Fructilactobacillus florum]ETO40298.1 Heat shock protein 60 family co-chaperone GroES [Fructilactobacillus florum 8D]
MLQPIGDRIIIKVQEPENQQVGGIVLADNAKEKPTEGEVIAVGAGKVLDDGKTVAPVVKTGDRVMFDKYAGTNVDYQGESYLVMHENDLLAILK